MGKGTGAIFFSKVDSNLALTKLITLILNNSVPLMQELIKQNSVFTKSFKLVNN